MILPPIQTWACPLCCSWGGGGGLAICIRHLTRIPYYNAFQCNKKGRDLRGSFTGTQPFTSLKSLWRLLPGAFGHRPILILSPFLGWPPPRHPLCQGLRLLKLQLDQSAPHCSLRPSKNHSKQTWLALLSLCLVWDCHLRACNVSKHSF